MKPEHSSFTGRDYAILSLAIAAGIGVIAGLTHLQQLPDRYLAIIGCVTVTAIVIIMIIGAVNRYRAKTKQRLAIRLAWIEAMAHKSDQELIRLFPALLDISPTNRDWNPDELDGAVIQLKKRNIAIPQMEVKPVTLGEVISPILNDEMTKACLVCTVFCPPLVWYFVHQRSFSNLTTSTTEHYVFFDPRGLFFLIGFGLCGVVGIVGLFVGLPYMLVAAHIEFRDRRRRVAALLQAIRSPAQLTPGSFRSSKAKLQNP